LQPSLGVVADFDELFDMLKSIAVFSSIEFDPPFPFEPFDFVIKPATNLCSKSHAQIRHLVLEAY